jgi:hypothetical protein
MWDGCSNWPAVGMTGVCSECIKIPERVQNVANRMFESVLVHDKLDRNKAWLMCFLENRNHSDRVQILRYVLELVESDAELSFEKAVERVRAQWNGGTRVAKKERDQG